MRDRWYHGLFVALLLVQLLLLSSNDPARGSRAEGFMLGVTAPLGRLVAGIVGLADGARGALRSNRGLRSENEELRRELARARDELIRLDGLQEEVRRVRGMDAASDAQTAFFVADVVYIDQTAGLRTLVLDGGDAHPKRNQVVRSPGGVVGRIIQTAGRYGKVQLVTDRASSVSAMVERTRRKGLVRGGDGGLDLTLLPHRADVRSGDRVVTAGIDGIYPRGIPIGTVTEVAAAPGLFLRIVLSPAVDFGLLEDVYVLTGEPVPEAIIQGTADALP